MRLKHHHLLAAFATLGLGMTSLASHATTWQVERVGAPAAGLNVAPANALNNAGRVAGTTADLHAVLTGTNGAGQLVIASPAGYQASASATNDLGLVTGAIIKTDYFPESSPPTFAFITSANGTGFTQLATLGGKLSVGYAINQSGQVAGVSSTANEAAEVPFITDANGSNLKAIAPVAPLTAKGEALALNDSGQVTGRMVHSSGWHHAFLTGTNGQNARDLGALGGISSAGLSVNSKGQVVGTYTPSNAAPGEIRGFITDANGANPRDIGTLGGTTVVASDINSAGVVVGQSTLADNTTQHAFITGPNGQGLVDLNTEAQPPNGGHFKSANNINDQGQVVATSSDNLTYLLTPVGTPQGSACTATLRVVRSGKPFTTAELLITNNGPQALARWNASWQYGESASVIVASGGTLSVSKTLIATAKSSANASVKPGATAKLSFLVYSKSGAPSTSNLSANLGGQACAIRP